MRIDNPLDELLYAATMGYPPDQDDLAAVVVPPGGMTAADLRADIVKTTEAILAKRRDGAPGEGRRIADEAARAYLKLFPTPQPLDRQPDDSGLRDLVDKIPRHGSFDFEREMSRLIEEQDS